MTSYQRWVTIFTSALWIVLTTAIWVAFAPMQVGGQATYVIVNGNSMEPDFHLGDLIIVRSEPVYRIGDEVVYQNSDLGGSVFHRIIDLELDRYTLKGDNNNWVDAYQPTQEEVTGKLWAHLPKFGKYIQLMRQPIVMALIAGALGGLLAISIASRHPKGRRRMKNKSLKELLSKVRKQSYRDWISNLINSRLIKTLRGNTEKPRQNPDQKGNRGESYTEGTFFLLGLLAFGSLILGIFAFARPASRVVPDNVSYQHLGFFSYSATAPDSVYDSGTVQSGEPIFPKTTCTLDVNFQYTLVGDQVEGIAGSYQMSAIVKEPQSGWQRNIPLQAEEVFSGNTFGTRANLDVCQVTALIEAMEEETGFSSGSYTFVIVPRIEVTGSVSGRELNDTFEPNLTFRYSQTHFYMLDENPEEDPLNPTETRILQGERKEPNTLPIFGLELKVPTLRIFSLLIFGISLSGIVLFGLQIQNLARNDRAAFMRMKFGSLIVDIKSGSIKDFSKLIDVTSIDDLAKLAERYNVMILHDAQDDTHAYYVQGDEITYRYLDENVLQEKQ